MARRRGEPPEGDVGTQPTTPALPRAKDDEAVTAPTLPARSGDAELVSAPTTPAPRVVTPRAGNADVELVSAPTLDDDGRRFADFSAAPPTAPGEGEDLPMQVVPEKFYRRSMEVARGGMGRIVVARDRRLGRWVAIKELLDRSFDARRFEREALITARLQHPSIVRVYEAGSRPSGEPFYAMEMVRGLSLDLVIADKKGFDERLALLPNVIAAVDALAYAHSQRIIHRDLKPGNVLVGKFGETVVIDWGLAKDLDAAPASATASDPEDPSLPRVHLIDLDAADSGLTMPGAVLGTPNYMPPEQARGENLDPRADVYSLGAILYCVLAGAPPYRGRTGGEVLGKVLSGPPPDVLSLAPATPPDLVAIVQRAMAYDPAARYPTAEELAADLRRFQTGQLVAAHRYSRVELLRRWLRRHRAIVSVSSAALLTLAIGGTVSVRGIIRARDTAEVARVRAEDAERRAILRADELMLGQAKAALARDPALSLAWLKELRVTSAEVGRRAEAIAADALARGVAWVLAGHSDDVNYVRFSPDGRWIASGSDDYSVRLWPVETSPRLRADVAHARVLAGHTAKVHTLRFSPDGSLVASGSVDGTVRLWDLNSGEARVLAGNRATVRDLAFSPDGQLLATAGQDRTLRLWDVRTGKQRWQAEHKDELRGVMFAPDGQRVGAVAADGAVGFYRVSDGSGRFVPGHRGLARSLRFSPDGATMVTTGEDGDLRVFALPNAPRTDLPRPQIWTGHTDAAKEVVFGPDGRWLVSVGQDHTVRLWTVRDGRSHLLGRHEAQVKALALTRDGRHLATAGSNLRILLFTLDDDGNRRGEPLALAGHSGAIKALDISPDGLGIASASDDDTVRLWRVAQPTLPPGLAPEANGGAAWRAFLGEATNLAVDAATLPGPKP